MAAMMPEAAETRGRVAMATVKLYQSTDIYSIAIGDFQYSRLSPGESTYITDVYDTVGDLY